MVFVVLFFMMPFTIDLRYHGDNLVDLFFSNKIETCEMEKIQIIPNWQKPKMEGINCCLDKQLISEGQDD